jgi:1,4-dihydroxy-2-naphthoyl-CoA synthase
MVSALIIEYVERIVKPPQVIYEEKIAKIQEVVMFEVVRQVPKTIVQFVNKQSGGGGLCWHGVPCTQVTPRRTSEVNPNGANLTEFYTIRY